MYLRTEKSPTQDSQNCSLERVFHKVSEDRLLNTVEALNYSRHYSLEKSNNQKARDWIHNEFQHLKYEVSFQGKYDNIIAIPENYNQPLFLYCGHYDTVPNCPGADDNSSSVAVCLEIATVAKMSDIENVGFAIFNREEDGLLGSIDFVSSLPQLADLQIREVHVFEMVGFYSDVAGSQNQPEGIPVKAPSIGNFIGLLSNRDSGDIARKLLSNAQKINGGLEVLNLQTMFGVEKFFSTLLRSDHAPFWQQRIPSVMWTDTSEFRNPNYHKPSDTPDTLNYQFMAKVTCLALTRAFNQ